MNCVDFPRVSYGDFVPILIEMRIASYIANGLTVSFCQPLRNVELPVGNVCLSSSGIGKSVSIFAASSHFIELSAHNTKLARIDVKYQDSHDGKDSIDGQLQPFDWARAWRIIYGGSLLRTSVILIGLGQYCFAFRFDW